MGLFGSIGSAFNTVTNPIFGSNGVLTDTKQVANPFAAPIDQNLYQTAGGNSAAQSAGFSQQAQQAQGGAFNAQENPYNNQSMAGLAGAAAGTAPSVAQGQLQQGLDASNAAQQSAAAGARGPGGLAMAQQNSAVNMANNQQTTNAQAAQLRAGEMATARGQLSQATQADYANNIKNQGQGLAYTQGLYGDQLHTQDQQNQANLANASTQFGQQQGRANVNATNAGIAAQNKQSNAGLFSTVIGAVDPLAALGGSAKDAGGGAVGDALATTGI